MKRLRRGFIAPLVFLLISGLIIVVVYTIPYLTITRGYSQATSSRVQLHTLLVSAVSLWQEIVLPISKSNQEEENAKKPAQVQQELYNKLLLKMLEVQNTWHTREFKEDEHGITARIYFYMRPSAGKIPLHALWDAKKESFVSIKSYRPADLVLYGLSRITRQQAAQSEDLLKGVCATSPLLDIHSIVRKAPQEYFAENITLYPVLVAQPTLSVADIFTSWHTPKDPAQRLYPLFLSPKLLDTSFDFVFKPALFAEGSEYAAVLKKVMADSVDWAKVWPELAPLLGVEYNTLPIHLRMSFMKNKPPLTQEVLILIEYSGYIASAFMILEPIFFEKLERYHLVVRDVTVMEIRTQKEIVKQD